MERLLAMALLVAAGGGDALGVHDAWGAFRTGSPPHCYAIAEPVGPGGAGGAFAAVSTWPARHRRQALFVRLAAAADPAVPVTLSIAERRFRLAGEGVAAWSPDLATDRAIVSAMRGARSMSVEAVTPAGRPFVAVYPLAGAATAIDAATLACVAGG